MHSQYQALPPFEKRLRFNECFSLRGMKLREPSQVIIVSRQVRGLLPVGPLEFRLQKFRRNSTDDAFRNLVLQVENIAQVAVEAVGPEMCSVSCVYQLPGNSDPSGRLPHAPF
jgi:hypothetical protein